MNYQYWQEISYFLNEIDREKALFEKSDMTAEKLESTRLKMTNFVEALKSSLEMRMDKYYASLMIFPIVAAIDEKMQAYDMTNGKIRWMPLQKDFYAAYNAGEIFFKTLDEILDNSNIPNIVFQVYYMMLKMGFQGKYRDSKTHINKYLEMLKDKIPVANLTEKKAAVPVLGLKSNISKLKKWHCYGLSFLLATSCYGLFVLIAHLE